MVVIENQNLSNDEKEKHIMDEHAPTPIDSMQQRR
jgi:hypothetical protein